MSRRFPEIYRSTAEVQVHSPNPYWCCSNQGPTVDFWDWVAQGASRPQPFFSTSEASLNPIIEALYLAELLAPPLPTATSLGTRNDEAELDAALPLVTTCHQQNSHHLYFEEPILSR